MGILHILKGRFNSCTKDAFVDRIRVYKFIKNFRLLFPTFTRAYIRYLINSKNTP